MMGDYESVCYKEGCHGRVCLAAAIYERARRTHESFYCSAGHSQCFVGESDQERIIRELRDKVTLLTRRVEWRDEQIDALRGRLLDCQWTGCEFHAANDKGLRTHMRAAHGMPSLALVRAAEGA